MRQAAHTLSIATRGKGLYAFTESVIDWVRAGSMQTSLSIPVIQGAPALGTWQGIYLFEHRLEPQRRQVVLHLLGE